jgi:nucleoside transporter
MASDPTTAPPLDPGLRLRLSIMMFLQFAIWGAWFVVFFDYLLKLNFNGAQAGWIFGNMALGAIISPMIVGLIADRYIASEKLMAILHLVGAGLLYWMAQIDQPDFTLYFTVSLIYALVYNPTLALANSISFSHVPDGTRDFPGLRVWGTIGWIVVNYVVGKSLDIGTNQPLVFAAGLSLALAVFSLALPHTPPTGRAGDPLPFVKAFSLFKEPSFAVFFIVSGVITIVLAFYYSNTATFLKSLDANMVPEGLRGYFVKSDAAPEFINPNTTMLIGQIIEMIVLPFLPIFLWRFGMKWVLVLGMVSWGLRYLLFSAGSPFSFILLGVALHGICFDFFFAAGFIHVDNEAPKDIRASGQALFALLTYGIGMWLGSVLSGFLKDYFTNPETKEVNWPAFWLVPSIGVFAAVLVFIAFFRIERKPID